jgi:HEAT repeat protein
VAREAAVIPPDSIGEQRTQRRDSTMRPSSRIALLVSGLVLAGAAPAPAADNAVLSDEQMLRAAGLAADGPALLDFFRRRAAVSADQEKLKVLIRQLGESDPRKAERAAGELAAIGPPAVPLLRQAAREFDGERSGHARRCLEFLEGPNAAALPAAAARVLATRQPAGAVGALLTYLPFADDETVADEVRAALSAVAVRGERAEPALLKALEDPSALCRAAAAEALCQAGIAEARPALRRLLNDPMPVVRLRAALALAQQHEPKAVSTLVALLADLPPAQAKHADDFLQALAGEQAPKVVLGNDPGSQERCRDAWAAWWLGTEGAAFLDEFKRRTLTDETRDKALGLIGQLGHDSFEVRQQATADLLAMGPAVVPFLSQSLNHPDAEVVSRVRKCLDAIAKEKRAPLSPVTVRLTALRRPAGAVEALLAYLPFAEDQTVAAEVQAALNVLALRDGQPEPALLRALEDKVGARRAAAAVALAQSGPAELRPTVRKLLHDPEPAVRLPVALALTARRDREAVPALIGLLAQQPPLGEQAESQLVQIAGERGPKITLGRDEASRIKARDAWAAWWREHGAAVELPRPAVAMTRELGYTLLALLDSGQVVELDRAGKVRWRLDGLAHPTDFHLLPGDRVLIAEHNNNRVTERNLKNEVLWERQLNNSAVSCQRLPSGNTFMASRSEIVEVDPAGKTVFSFNRPDGDIMAAQKLRDGQVVFATSSGTCVRLDAGGREVKTFAIGGVVVGSLEVLPNGRILIPQYNTNKVVEYDLEGRAVWEAAATQPIGAARLASGNTLVSSHGSMQLLELDRAGKVVWEFRTEGRPGRVRRR